MTISQVPLRNVAVILAGGTGQRVGLKIPKQLLKIAGRPMIEHTIKVFQNAAEIDEIVILMEPGHIEDVERIVARGGYDKVSRVLAGGRTRTDTTSLAIAALSGGHDDCNVLFHDAVRPFVEHRIISECVAALAAYEAVDVAIPSADTIIVVDDYSGAVIKDVPRRATLRRGQTPQCFRLSTIRRAYELALADPDFTGGKVPATDDCSVVLRYLPDVPIVVVTGSEHNMKVTHPVDVFIADKLFQVASSAPPPAATPDDHAARLSGRTVVVFGGSYGIGADIVELARGLGANVCSFSRSQTGTHVESTHDVEAALARAYAETGRIDYVVNTAGVLRMGKLADADDAAIEEALRVNYLAPVTIARAALPYLTKTRGQLLLYTSSSYTRGRADYSLYSSTKAAVVNLMQALADEWSEFGVRVNCLNPERTATPMRVRAFGAEPPETLLSSRDVALTSIDVLVSELTGHVVDVRQEYPVLTHPVPAAPAAPAAAPVPAAPVPAADEIDYIVETVARAEAGVERDAGAAEATA
jgi:ribitol-5-phosphate 2-dehydrogenase (NADP+) / D-ribitol-5-phosphate cytidylyltransferase